MTCRRSAFFLLALALLFSSCATKDNDHRILVSVADQSLELYHRERLLGRYPVSTSKFGLGDRPGSRATPLGRMEVAKKIGAGAPLGAVFKSRRQTGEILAPDAPGRDPIVTRIIWLKGLEPQNRHAFARCIYIHGTPEERNVGRPASFGCMRMKSSDVLRVFNTVGIGATVDIIPGFFAGLSATARSSCQSPSCKRSDGWPAIPGASRRCLQQLTRASRRRSLVNHSARKSCSCRSDETIAGQLISAPVHPIILVPDASARKSHGRSGLSVFPASANSLHFPRSSLPEPRIGICLHSFYRARDPKVRQTGRQQTLPNLIQGKILRRE